MIDDVLLKIQEFLEARAFFDPIWLRSHLAPIQGQGKIALPIFKGWSEQF